MPDGYMMNNSTQERVDRAPRSSVGSNADVVQPVRREASLSNDPGSTPIIEALAQVAAVAWEARAWAPNDVLRDFFGFLRAVVLPHRHYRGTAIVPL